MRFKETRIKDPVSYFSKISQFFIKLINEEFPFFTKNEYFLDNYLFNIGKNNTCSYFARFLDSKKLKCLTILVTFIINMNLALSIDRNLMLPLCDKKYFFSYSSVCDVNCAYFVVHILRYNVDFNYFKNIEIDILKLHSYIGRDIDSYIFKISLKQLSSLKFDEECKYIL